MKKVTIPNAIHIKPLPRKIEKKKLPKGHQLFDRLTYSVGLFATTNSGKTVALSNIIKYSCDDRTTVVAFVGSPDKEWDVIRDYCEKHDIRFIMYPSIFDEKTGENLLKTYMDKLVEKKRRDQAVKKELEKAKQNKKQAQNMMMRNPLWLNLQEDSASESESEDEEEFDAPAWMFLLDDLGVELRNKYVAKFLQTVRHIGCIIMCCQYLKQLQPQSLNNLFYILQFSGLSDEILELTHKYSGTKRNYNQYKELYKDATSKPYSFLNNDTKSGSFRQNFEAEYQ